MWTDLADSLHHSSWRFGAVLFVFLMVRHFGMAGAFYLAFWKIWPARLAERKIQTDQRKTHEGEEMFWSFSTVVIQSILGGLLFELWDRELLRLYLDAGERGPMYFAFSIAALFVWHDAYFFWMHRLLHTHFFFKHVHIIHHRSTNPTPFSALSFHPIEALLEMGFLIPFLALVPMHPTALMLFLLITNFFAISGHLGYEMAPPALWDSWWGRWITSNTHHNVHHQYPNGNFALYLRYWDIWSGTLSERTEGEFRRVSAGSRWRPAV